MSADHLTNRMGSNMVGLPEEKTVAPLGVGEAARVQLWCYTMQSNNYWPELVRGCWELETDMLTIRTTF